MESRFWAWFWNSARTDLARIWRQLRAGRNQVNWHKQTGMNDAIRLNIRCFDSNSLFDRIPSTRIVTNMFFLQRLLLHRTNKNIIFFTFIRLIRHRNLHIRLLALILRPLLCVSSFQQLFRHGLLVVQVGRLKRELAGMLIRSPRQSSKPLFWEDYAIDKREMIYSPIKSS